MTDIESCTLADLELMYVDALWSFYHPDTRGTLPWRNETKPFLQDAFSSEGDVAAPFGARACLLTLMRRVRCTRDARHQPFSVLPCPASHRARPRLHRCLSSPF